MNIPIIVVGKRGRLGSQVFNALATRSKNVIAISAFEIASKESADLNSFIDEIMREIKIHHSPGTSLGLVLCHRIRGMSIPDSLTTELKITRDFVFLLSEKVERLKVTVIGSITGKRVDPRSDESYHFCKNLQRSIVNYSVTIPQISMNLVELNTFKKFSENFSREYEAYLSNAGRLIGMQNIPEIENIIDLIKFLCEDSYCIRGQVIPVDGGLSLFQ